MATWDQIIADPDFQGLDTSSQATIRREWYDTTVLPELMATIEETGAEEIWVTHGREEAIVHAARLMGFKARALALVGREDEAE